MAEIDREETATEIRKALVLAMIALLGSAVVAYCLCPYIFK